jgi:hypothetical protein
MLLLKKYPELFRAILILLLAVSPALTLAQELNCKVVVNSDRIARSDKQVFRDMEIAFSDFLNDRRWTTDVFQNEERIKCNLNISIDEMPSISSFRATVQIQSARPVHNSTYESIVLNFADRDWTFDYVESQPLDFNPNSYTSNLTSMLAYYANIIIGLDYDSFGSLSGTSYFQRANNIVTNATPSNRPGWSSLESNRNRFWLVENLLNQRMAQLRESIYTYHRLGLDIYQEKPEEAQQNILQVLRLIQDVRRTYPESILVITFLDSKVDELINLFSSAPIQAKRDDYNLLIDIDPSKRDKYARIISN